MVEEKRYCVDILNQISSVRAALDAVGVELLTSHIKTCVIGHGSGQDHTEASVRTEEELLNEIKLVLNRFLK